ncbi:MAG: hypothetical protein ACT6QS_09490, partial [Flavobacteriales bacterium]
MENSLRTLAAQFLSGLVPAGEVSPAQVLLNPIPADFEGDVSVVLFPFLKLTGKRPDELGEALGAFLQQNMREIGSWTLVKGFLNLTLTPENRAFLLKDVYAQHRRFGMREAAADAPNVLIEYP